MTLRAVSKKRRKRINETKQFRQQLREDVGECEICGANPHYRHMDKPAECSELVVHEIANGPNRNKALDKSYAVLVLCSWCNQSVVTDKSVWPESRQLAELAKRRPRDFDLFAYLELTSPNAPNRITISEVLQWMEEEYLSKRDIAQLIQVDRRAVQKWIDSGELPAMDARAVGSSRPLWRVSWENYLTFCRRRSTE